MSAGILTARRAALPLCLALALAGCKEELYTNLTEREANDIVAALVNEGIPANKTAGGEGSTVNVDSARFGEAMTILNKKGLPSKDYVTIDDLFPSDGMIKTPMEERARMTYALSEEISRTIAEIDGVLSARVHVVLPEADMLGRDIKPSSASIFIRYAPNTNVEQYAAQIKLLAANSIEGLLYDNITVIMVPAAPADAEAATGPRLVDVFGIWAHPASQGRLMALIGGLVALAAAGFLAAGWPWVAQAIRRRRGERGPAHQGAFPNAATEDDGNYG